MIDLFKRLRKSHSARFTVLVGCAVFYAGLCVMGVYNPYATLTLIVVGAFPAVLYGLWLLATPPNKE